MLRSSTSGAAFDLPALVSASISSWLMALGFVGLTLMLYLASKAAIRARQVVRGRRGLGDQDRAARGCAAVGRAAAVQGGDPCAGGAAHGRRARVQAHFELLEGAGNPRSASLVELGLELGAVGHRVRG